MKREPEVKLSVQDLNAAQRTFEGAYTRTALAKFAFGVLILRVFERSFLPIGILYEVSAFLTLIIAINSRRRERRLKLVYKFQTARLEVALTFVLDFITLLCLLIFVAKLR